MHRLYALVVVAMLALGAAIGVRAQSSADLILSDLQSFWSSEFVGAAQPYWRPEVIVLGEPIDTACGTLSASFGPGAYCSADATLYFSPIWFDGLAVDSRDQILMTVLAHEWGHHIQYLLGIQWRPDASYELQADCLAGVYARHAEGIGMAEPGALADSVRLAALSGDVGALPQDAAEHGTGAERAISFMNGYSGGIGGCGIVL